VTSLLAGEYFGSFEFFFDVVSEVTYKTGTYTELVVLEREHFNELMNNPRFDGELHAINSSLNRITDRLNLDELGKIDEDFIHEQEKTKNIITRKRSQGTKGEIANNVNNDDGDCNDSGRSTTSDELERQLLPQSLLLHLQNEKKILDERRKGKWSSSSNNNNNEDDEENDLTSLEDIRESERSTGEPESRGAMLQKLKDQQEQQQKVFSFIANSANGELQYHPGVTNLVLSWWQQRNNIHKQIVIFKKNMLSKVSHAKRTTIEIRSFKNSHTIFRFLGSLQNSSKLC